MGNISGYIDDLEQAIIKLGDTFEGQTTDYLACAVYLATDDQKSVFALSHAGRRGDYKHYARTDKHVYRRRLDVKNSIAAEAFLSDRFSLANSRMFSAHQDCAHISLFDSKDASQRAMLQIALRKGTDLTELQLTNILRRDGYLGELSKKALPIITLSKDKRDQLFRVRDPYKPNAIMALFDISKFKVLSKKLGAYRGQDVADSFVHDFVKRAADKYEPELLRMEGDGVWMAFPVGKESEAEAFARAQGMADYLIDNFADFIQTTDKRAVGTHLKAVFELGETRNTFWHQSSALEKPDDRSGPVFTAIESASKSLSLRSRNEILIGPELRATLDKQDTYNIDPDKFTQFNIE